MWTEEMVPVLVLGWMMLRVSLATPPLYMLRSWHEPFVGLRTKWIGKPGSVQSLSMPSDWLRSIHSTIHTDELSFYSFMVRVSAFIYRSDWKNSRSPC